MEELNQKPDELKNVRYAGWLEKRSSSFPYGWNRRYVIISCNFIYVYSNNQVCNGW